MSRITETHVAVANVNMVTVNVGGETNIAMTLMRGRRLRKCIELRENGAAENYSGPSANIPKLRNSC